MEVHKLTGIYFVRDELQVSAAGKKYFKTFVFTAGVFCMILQLSMKALLFLFQRKTQKALVLAACGGSGPWRPLGGMSSGDGSPTLPLTGPNAASRSRAALGPCSRPPVSSAFAPQGRSERRLQGNCLPICELINYRKKK